jgi:hypothetical protein
MLGLSKASKYGENLPKPTKKSPTRSLSPSKSKKNIINLGKSTLATETSDHRSIKHNQKSSDVRELNTKMIASINWLKHSHIKREQIPTKLRSCFLVTKSVIHTDD